MLEARNTWHEPKEQCQQIDERLLLASRWAKVVRGPQVERPPTASGTNGCSGGKVVAHEQFGVLGAGLQLPDRGGAIWGGVTGRFGMGRGGGGGKGLPVLCTVDVLPLPSAREDGRWCLAKWVLGLQ